MNKKLDVSITPLRLVVTIASLALAGISEFFGWNIPIFYSVLPIILVVFLTQPKVKK